jgi:hypothetical protein
MVLPSGEVHHTQPTCGALITHVLCVMCRVACRVGKRVTGPAVSFTADVLLPTPFLGPTLATYLIIMLLIKVNIRIQ